MWRLISGIRDTHSARRDILFNILIFFFQEVNVKPKLLSYNSMFSNDYFKTNNAFVHWHREKKYLFRVK